MARFTTFIHNLLFILVLQRNIMLHEELEKLPLIAMGTVAKDNEIFERDIYRAHFKVTKEYVPVIGKIYALSVSGNTNGQQRIVEEFKNELGDPIHDFMLTPNIRYVAWKAERVD